jgi:hypothetical protein
MKKMLATPLFVLINFLTFGQDFNTMTGDWIRVNAEFKDGRKIPGNHTSRVLIRYHFTKKEVYHISPGSTLPSEYVRTGNILKIGPVQTFAIEEYTDKALTLVDNGREPIRYFLIPTDSFQISGLFKYPYEVINGDTVYTNRPGIEPIYPKGQNDFMTSIMTGFTQQVAFDFSYVVKKDGTIGDVIINASTNEKLNKRLIQLVKKSSGKWIPGNYKGEPINVLQTEKIALNSR